MFSCLLHFMSAIEPAGSAAASSAGARADRKAIVAYKPGSLCCRMVVTLR